MKASTLNASTIGRFVRPLTLSLLAGAALALATPALASSHREAPQITETPKVDATDFYMFNSYEQGRAGYVTLIADYIPFQTVYGGPNFFTMDPDALYQIHIDNDGDAREDITFSFRFRNELRDTKLNIGGTDVSIPLVNFAPVGPDASQNAGLNVVETYTVDVVWGDQYRGRSERLCNVAGATRFPKPVDNIGAKSIPNYENYAISHIQELTLPGSNQRGRVLVAQRKDPFVVNLGEAFDLVNLNPLGPVNGKQDSLADDNCTSLILEVPAEFLKGKEDSVIGGWTTASLPQVRVLRNRPTFANPTQEAGQWIQVSRLSMPLVNELVIGVKDKDLFNASRPRNDQQFATYVTNPTLPALLQSLFGVTAPCTPRTDLVSVFLTGVEGLNKPSTVTPAEMMRLNVNTDAGNGGIAITPASQQNPLGVLGGDAQGYPNGRRPGDDVVDISLRAVMGVLLPNAGQPGSCAPSGNLPYTDGAFIDANRFGATFPYLRSPLASSPQ
jgi:hypothetical protein